MQLRKKQGPGLRIISAADTTQPLTLECYDVIGRDMWGDGVTASAVRAALESDAGKAAREIHMRINSPGGDAFEGVAIYNILRDANTKGKRVTTMVDGLGASAAFTVFMAGDARLMGLGTHAMMHTARGFSFGDGPQLRQMADVLDQVSDSTADIYANASGIAKAQVMDMMAAETWLNTDDAIAKKFATGSMPTNALSFGDFQLTGFANVPAVISGDIHGETFPDVQDKLDRVRALKK